MFGSLSPFDTSRLFGLSSPCGLSGPPIPPILFGPFGPPDPSSCQVGSVCLCLRAHSSHLGCRVRPIWLGRWASSVCLGRQASLTHVCHQARPVRVGLDQPVWGLPDSSRSWGLSNLFVSWGRLDPSGSCSRSSLSWLSSLLGLFGVESRVWGWVRRISSFTYFESIWISTNLVNWNTSKKCLYFKYFLIFLSKQSILL